MLPLTTAAQIGLKARDPGDGAPPDVFIARQKRRAQGLLARRPLAGRAAVA